MTLKALSIAMMLIVVCLTAGCDPLYTYDKQKSAIIKADEQCYAISFRLRYDFGTETIDGIFVDSAVKVPCPGANP